MGPGRRRNGWWFYGNPELEGDKGGAYARLVSTIGSLEQNNVQDSEGGGSEGDG